MAYMTNTSPGWAVQISGHDHDLAALKILLAPPGEPWVEDDSTSKDSILLRSSAWAGLQDASQVHAAAALLVEHINGALPMTTMNPDKIQLGAVYCYKPTGGRDVAVFVQAISMVVASARITVQVNGVMQPIVQGDIRKVLQAAGSDPVKADLLTYLTRADNWFDIYKAAELVRHLAGSEAKLKADLQQTNEWTSWKLVWRTANFHRHTSISFPIPKVFANLGAAREIVTRIAHRYL